MTLHFLNTYDRYGELILEVYVKSKKFGTIKKIDGHHEWDRSQGKSILKEYRLTTNDGERVHYRNIAECKQEILRQLQNDPDILEQQKAGSNIPTASLPVGDNANFYPTPSGLVGRMLAQFSTKEWRLIRQVLEPSAGKGNIVNCVEQFAKNNSIGELQVDCIEIDPNLQALLNGQNRTVVWDNFLTFQPYTKYDLILMNPPFDNGDLHLLHALELIQNGGRVCCILNAETIRNPYTNRRKVLRDKLMGLNARIEFVQGAFLHAERPSDVEVAMVTVSIPNCQKYHNIADGLKAAKEYTPPTQYEPTEIAMRGDWLGTLLRGYRAEAEAGMRLIEEYNALKPWIMDGSDKYSKPLIELRYGYSRDSEDVSSPNAYLRQLRKKYWCMLMYSDKLESVTGAIPSKMREEYGDSVAAMKDVEFDEFNIRRLILNIQSQLTKGISDSVMALFQKFSEEHSWYPECQKNIHYYNGWKTNKAHKVGMKVIIPIAGAFAASWRHELLDSYSVYSILSDLEKVMHFLDQGQTSFRCNLKMEIERANITEKPVVETTYFTAKFYKKGTCHIIFHPDAQHIVDRMNIFAGQQYHWLPPYYGKVKYEEMEEEGKAVIDGFQGRDSYNKVVLNPQAYLWEPTAARLVLQAGA